MRPNRIKSEQLKTYERQINPSSNENKWELMQIKLAIYNYLKGNVIKWDQILPDRKRCDQIWSIDHIRHYIKPKVPRGMKCSQPIKKTTRKMKLDQMRWIGTGYDQKDMVFALIQTTEINKKKDEMR